MENKETSETKKKAPCVCTMILGVLIIVFAWWKISWGAIALTILGAFVILKGLVNQCCCAEKKSSCCAPKQD